MRVESAQIQQKGVSMCDGNAGREGSFEGVRRSIRARVVLALSRREWWHGIFSILSDARGVQADKMFKEIFGDCQCEKCAAISGVEARPNLG